LPERQAETGSNSCHPQRREGVWTGHQRSSSNPSIAAGVALPIRNAGRWRRRMAEQVIQESRYRTKVGKTALFVE
jgi:hypothetical protein